MDQGITQVTIQPEFYINNVNPVLHKLLTSEGVCLMKCQSAGCKSSACCPQVKIKLQQNNTIKYIKMYIYSRMQDLNQIVENAANMISNLLQWILLIRRYSPLAKEWQQIWKLIIKLLKLLLLVLTY